MFTPKAKKLSIATLPDVQGLFEEKEHQREAQHGQARPEDVRKQVREPGFVGTVGRQRGDGRSTNYFVGLSLPC